MTVELTGTVKAIGELQTRGKYTWVSVFLVIDEDTKYPQTVEVQFSGNNADKLDFTANGEKVKVSANIRGNESNGRVYMSLSGYQIQSI